MTDKKEEILDEVIGRMNDTWILSDGDRQLMNEVAVLAIDLALSSQEGLIKKNALTITKMWEESDKHLNDIIKGQEEDIEKLKTAEKDASSGGGSRQAGEVDHKSETKARPSETPRGKKILEGEE